MQNLRILQTKAAVYDATTILPLANMNLAVQNTPMFHVYGQD